MSEVPRSPEAYWVNRMPCQVCNSYSTQLIWDADMQMYHCKDSNLCEQFMILAEMLDNTEGALCSGQDSLLLLPHMPCALF